MTHHCDFPTFAMLKLLSHAERLLHPRRLQKGRCSEQQVVLLPIFAGFQEYFTVPLPLSLMRGLWPLVGIQHM